MLILTKLRASLEDCFESRRQKYPSTADMRQNEYHQLCLDKMNANISEIHD